MESELESDQSIIDRLEWLFWSIIYRKPHFLRASGRHGSDRLIRGGPVGGGVGKVVVIVIDDKSE